MIRKSIIIYLSTILISLNSCNESPSIVFHSYDELSKYDFINNGWFPEILMQDAYKIQETYDINNKHLYGKFEFKDRLKYDSIIQTYTLVNLDSLKIQLDNIDKPKYPEWFLTLEGISKDNCTLVKHHEFYLILEKRINRIYFLR